MTRVTLLRGYAPGDRAEYIDPALLGFGDCGTVMDDWEPGDSLKILGFELVEGVRYPICWNPDKQTASSVVWELIKPLKES